MKMDFKEDSEWGMLLELTQDRVQWWALLLVMLNLQVLLAGQLVS
jgi:hypothetical protein